MADRTSDILILGTGALATLFAARFSSASFAVTVLGSWAEGLAALNAHGAWLEELGPFPVRAVSEAQDCLGSRYALVLVKAWQTERTAQQLKICLAQDGLALTLQNGLGNREILEAALGPERVALGVTTVGAALLAPGRVRLGGEGIVQVEAHPRLSPMVAMLHRAGFVVEQVADAQTLLWSKLVVSSAINPLTALLGIPNGALLDIPSAYSLMVALAEETAAVADALGVVLPDLSPKQQVEEVARLTARNYSSMLQDIRRGAPTEIDAICGAVARKGIEAGRPAPLNQTLRYLVRALSERQRVASS